MSWQLFEKKMQQITDQFISEIEKGTIMFTDLWTRTTPANIVSKKHYDGFNMLYLSFVCQKHRYMHPYFITFNQAKELGGHVKAMESGYPVIFWKISGGSAIETDDSGNETTTSIRKRFTPFHWTVFNIDQIAGIEFDIPPVNQIDPSQTIQLAESIVNGYNQVPVIQVDQNRAYYSPMNDHINMPPKSRFNKIESYYSVLFHEMIHSTGHHTRLNRFKDNYSAPFASPSYSKEELVAELGASFLNFKAGIHDETFKSSAAYLQGWVSSFKDHPTMLHSAANNAMKAVELIIGEQKQ